MLTPKYEHNLFSSGFRTVIGIDEVGRGCWAGPVAVGAYIYTLNTPLVRGVHDSKLLSPQKRESVYKRLSKHQFKVAYGSVEEINEFGIGRTIESLITMLVNDLTGPEVIFLVDGQFKSKFAENVHKYIRGDSTYYSIAAASILAKFERDQLMRELDKEFPQYGFGIHKGYGTKSHRQALAEHGICYLHRQSFAPIQKLRIVDPV